MNSNTARFHDRFRQVLEYIENRLDDNLTVDVLSTVAVFSKYHFHRQFSGLFGIGVYQYVQLCRLKRASYQLAFRVDQPIIDIALASGYEGPEAFSRAFKKRIGQSPSEFRRQPQWAYWHDIYQPLNNLRVNHMKVTEKTRDVKVIHFDQTHLATLEHHGDPRLIGDSIRRFIAWRKENELSPRLYATFNILYEDPAGVAPEDFQMDLCVAVNRDYASPAAGIVMKTIPPGRCAVLRHMGSDDTLGESIRYLYSRWLPESGEEPRDFPIYLQRVRSFPDVPEIDAVTDVFLPIR